MSGEAMSGEAMSGEAMSGEAMSGEAMSGEAMSGKGLGNLWVILSWPPIRARIRAKGLRTVNTAPFSEPSILCHFCMCPQPGGFLKTPSLPKPHF
ncbi:MAG: hypothetical protein Fur0046_32410 [Cyanobacteria bacterium J069]